MNLRRGFQPSATLFDYPRKINERAELNRQMGEGDFWNAQDITLTVGAKHAIYMSLMAIIEPGAGDEVILPTPAWVSYKPLIELAGAACIEVPSSVATNFKMTAAQLEAAITPRTRAVMLNSPSNPCGRITLLYLFLSFLIFQLLIIVYILS